MDVSFTNSRESLGTAKQPQVEWSQLTFAERRRFLELEGYLVLPDLLTGEQIAAVGDELARLPLTSVDYSEHQKGHPDVQWSDSPLANGLVANPVMTEFLTQVFGDELVCTDVGYAVSDPGHPGIAIHTDSQPYGSKIFGMEASSPCLVRVLYYLDELTPERSPFKVIPRSHLSLHADAVPYNRYLSHEEELMVTCSAGSAVVLNQKVFHGNFPNYSETPRRMLAIAYRPAWAGPVADVDEHNSEQLQALAPAVRKFFASPNTRRINYEVPNRPDNMGRSAEGISPQRWG